MGNPLLTFWHMMFVPPGDTGVQSPESPSRESAPVHAVASTGPIFLVLRRMRAPLIVLILVFSISVLGLALILGEQPDGGTEPMSFFDAFYFMSYTATTIGFGEIPYPLTIDQRLWVTFSIYLAVIGWAYAIGTLLALLQDRAFRKSVETQRFARQVARIPEPFLALVGYGEAGARVARTLDARGRRLVVVDRAQDRIDALALEPLRADAPALSANTRTPHTLMLAGLGSPRCEGVLALTDDDEANLAVVQAVHLIRPGLPVIARADTAAASLRMEPFGEPTVVNPYDAFGDRLRVALRTPSLSRLVDWLILPPGEPLPGPINPPESGAWVVVGSARAVGEVVSDLQAVGLPVTVVDPGSSAREGTGPEEQAFAALATGAVGIVVAADRDTQTVSYVDAARRANPAIIVVARQESPANDPLFAALAPDVLLVPAEVVAREVLERLSNPHLWRFLQSAKDQSEPWAAQVLQELVARVGQPSPTVWEVSVDHVQAPSLCRRLASGPVTLGQLMASPWGRVERLGLMALMLERGAERTLAPDEDVELAVGDLLLMAGATGTQRAWDATLYEDDLLAYVLSGEAVATSWWGRRLFQRQGTTVG
jgi:Trk K+ transport system NAD-binding subunit